MLELIRNNVQSTGVKLIVAVVLIFMVFFGLNAFRNQDINSIAVVDGHEIKAENYQRAYEQTQEEVRQTYGNQASNYMKVMNIPAQIIQRLINTVLIMKSAEKNGFGVTDLELAQNIFDNPVFQTDGRFDEKKYNQMLTNIRSDKLTYEKDLRENLLTEKYLKFLASDMLINRHAVVQEIKKYTTEMDLRIIDITPSMFLDSTEVSEAEIEEYYNNHQPEFQQKRQFTLRYFILGLEDVLEGIVVRDREITRYYEKNLKTEFTKKASFKSRHILISVSADADEQEDSLAKDKAALVYTKLQSGESSFEDLAKTYSTDPGSAANGGDLGWVEKGSFVPEFEDVVNKLEVNQVSKPFRSQFGYHIVELLGNKQASTVPLEEVRQEIEETVKNNKATRRLENRVAKLIEKEDATFESMAMESEKPVSTSEKFDDSSNLGDIGYSYDLYQNVASKKVDETSYLKLADGERILVYQVAEIIDPFVKSLDDVKEDATYYARSLKAEETMKQKLVEFKSEIKNQDQFFAIAERFDVNPKSGKTTMMDRNNALMLSDSARSAAFKLEKGQIATIVGDRNGYLIMLMDKTEVTNEADDEEIFDNVRNAIVSQKANAVLGGLINQMRTESEISLNQPMLDALNIQLN